MAYIKFGDCYTICQTAKYSGYTVFYLEFFINEIFSIGITVVQIKRIQDILLASYVGV